MTIERPQGYPCGLTLCVCLFFRWGKDPLFDLLQGGLHILIGLFGNGGNVIVLIQLYGLPNLQHLRACLVPLGGLDVQRDMLPAGDGGVAAVQVFRDLQPQQSRL